MKCMYCEGEMVRGKPPFDIDHKNASVGLDNVPMWFCVTCEEVYFEEAEGYF